MRDDIILLLISAAISFVMSIVVTIAYDRRYVFFNKGKEKYDIEKSSPKILFGKQQVFINDKDITNIFTAEIVCDENKKESGGDVVYSFDFNKISSVSAAEDRFDNGFRLHNHTDEGITLVEFYRGKDEIISFSNLTARNIDAGCSVIILYNLRNRPTTISAQFKGYKITYEFSLENNYISPKCIEKLRKKDKKGSKV